MLRTHARWLLHPRPLQDRIGLSVGRSGALPDPGTGTASAAVRYAQTLSPRLLLRQGRLLRHQLHALRRRLPERPVPQPSDAFPPRPESSPPPPAAVRQVQRMREGGRMLQQARLLWKNRGLLRKRLHQRQLLDGSAPAPPVRCAQPVFRGEVLQQIWMVRDQPRALWSGVHLGSVPRRRQGQGIEQQLHALYRRQLLQSEWWFFHWQRQG
mmetsp:Transcript_55225/g.165473  ORF Transcript_55225/g.165473 Transcript_55225/m.165473 type:complete len:211 (+) Transcript_55225:1660-2292(+)